MAFRNKDGMAISFDSEELIAELKSDITEFGAEKEVNVWCRMYEGVTLYTNYDFIVAEKPITKKEVRADETIAVMKMGELLKLMEQQNFITIRKGRGIEDV